MATINEIVALLAPIVPEGFDIRLPRQARCLVLANPSDAFRIIFNLVQNAVAARRHGAPMSHVGIDVVRNGPTVEIRIDDDGPGLPAVVRARLFRHRNASSTGGSGLGIAIARELAERNGGSLRLVGAAQGTSYRGELSGG